MKKTTFTLIVIVVAAFLTATVLGFQNGTSTESNEVPEPPEFARDTAIDYILSAHEELIALSVPTSWEMQNLTPGILGASKFRYTSDGWNVTVSYPIVLEPTYTIEVDYAVEPGFQWNGTVSHNWNVSETNYTIK